MEVECNWPSVEMKRGAKVLQPAAVTQEESFVNSIITCGFYNDIHSIFTPAAPFAS